MSENIEQPLPRTFEEFNEQRKAAFIRVKDYKQAGNRLVGFLWLIGQNVCPDRTSVSIH